MRKEAARAWDELGLGLGSEEGTLGKLYIGGGERDRARNRWIQWRKTRVHPEFFGIRTGPKFTGFNTILMGFSWGKGEEIERNPFMQLIWKEKLVQLVEATTAWSYRCRSRAARSTGCHLHLPSLEVGSPGLDKLTSHCHPSPSTCCRSMATVPVSGCQNNGVPNSHPLLPDHPIISPLPCCHFAVMRKYG